MIDLEFEIELTALLNQYSIENELDMPDYMIAEMIVKMLKAMGPIMKKNLDWHDVDSVCHPATKESQF